MVQTPPVTTISESYNNAGTSGKVNLRFLQLVQGWKPDRMYSMPSNALGLKYFEGRVRPYGYISDIRRLTTTFWKDDSVMEDDLQNLFRTGYPATLPRRFFGCISVEKEGTDYGCLETAEQRIP